MTGKRLETAAQKQARIDSLLDKKAEKKAARQPITTMKWIVFICLLNGIAWVWCSYILAFQDKYVIAESLSQVAITEIIGVVLVYAVKALVENLSKNNNWPDGGSRVAKKTTKIVETSNGFEVEQAEDASVSALDFLDTGNTEIS